MRLIDADNLRQRMYHEAFETDTDLQRWDSGCWIRYKMFEEAIESQPTIDAVPVIRCKDCKHKIINENVPRKPIICCRTLMVGETDPDWFCADGERQEGG